MPFFCFAQQAVTEESCTNTVKKRLVELKDETWQVWRKNPTYNVAYIENKSSAIKIRAAITLNISADDFIDILHDVKHIPRWMAQAKSASIIQDSPLSNTLTLNFDEVWPVGPRELIISSTIIHCSPFHYIKVKNVDKKASDPAIIKMKLLEGFWVIKTIQPNQISVNYVSSIDPKGDIPPWVAQKVALRNIWQTLDNLQKLTKAKL